MPDGHLRQEAQRALWKVLLLQPELSPVHPSWYWRSLSLWRGPGWGRHLPMPARCHGTHRYSLSWPSLNLYCWTGPGVRHPPVRPSMQSTGGLRLAPPQGRARQALASHRTLPFRIALYRSLVTAAGHYLTDVWPSLFANSSLPWWCHSYLGFWASMRQDARTSRCGILGVYLMRSEFSLVLLVSLLRHTLRLWFFLCKVSASGILQGQASGFRQIFQKIWGRLAAVLIFSLSLHTTRCSSERKCCRSSEYPKVHRMYSCIPSRAIPSATPHGLPSISTSPCSSAVLLTSWQTSPASSRRPMDCWRRFSASRNNKSTIVFLTSGKR